MAKVHIKAPGKTRTSFDETQITKYLGVGGVDGDTGEGWGSWKGGGCELR